MFCKSRPRLSHQLAALCALLLSTQIVLAKDAEAPVTKEAKAQTKTEQLDYAKDMAHLFNEKCANCHQSNGVAPFALDNYADVKKRVSTISAVIESGYMPPWKPTKEFGQFQNERALSDAELASIKTWIKNGAPSGDLSTAPKPQTMAAGKWRGGKPDMIIKMTEPYMVPADGPDIYRCFVFPIKNVDNKFVSHVEFHPANPKVMHHALFFLDNLGEARKKDAESSEQGFPSFGGPGFLPTGSLGGWAPGNSMLPLPDGVARILRKDSDLVVQLHLHPDGKKEPAQFEMGIYYSTTAPKKILLPLTIRSRKIDIPANEKSHIVTTSTTVPNDFDLLQVTPHAHLLCKQIKASAKTPEGKTVPLIWIKNWDFNWQEQYAYKAPIHLPKGTVVQAEFTYDNSEDNFRNPNHPPKRVTWGEETGDEMALIFFSGTVSNNAEMSSYMRETILGAAKDLPRALGNPLQVVNALSKFLNPNNNPAKILEQAQKSSNTK